MKIFYDDYIVWNIKAVACGDNFHGPKKGAGKDKKWLSLFLSWPGLTTFQIAETYLLLLAASALQIALLIMLQEFVIRHLRSWNRRRVWAFRITWGGQFSPNRLLSTPWPSFHPHGHLFLFSLLLVTQFTLSLSLPLRTVFTLLAALPQPAKHLSTAVLCVSSSRYMCLCLYSAATLSFQSPLRGRGVVSRPTPNAY